MYMSELTDDHITLIISGSLGGFFLSILSYVLRKYCKNSKCKNALGEVSIEMKSNPSTPKPEENISDNI